MSDKFCPATMCPLFAANGSPWTGHKNAPCPGHNDWENKGCGFWDNGCYGCKGAIGQIDEVMESGHTFQIGNKRGTGHIKPRDFDCPRANDCQWQAESSPRLCPPRFALKHGIDPKYCAY